MRLSDLQKKDVVNVNDGSKIGNIIDIRLDDKGNMDGFIVEKNKFYDGLQLLWYIALAKGKVT